MCSSSFGKSFGLGGVMGLSFGAAGSLLGGGANPPQPASMPTPPTPQAAKLPGMSVYQASNRAANSGGVNATLLTGALGVDNNSLSLGKSTLLGS